MLARAVNELATSSRMLDTVFFLSHIALATIEYSNSGILFYIAIFLTFRFEYSNGAHFSIRTLR